MDKIFEPSLDEPRPERPPRSPARGYSKFEQKFYDFDYKQVDDILQMGAIDIHIHAAPCAYVKRPYTMIEVALKACEAGLKAIVFKSHAAPTAASQSLVQYVVDQWAAKHEKTATRILGGTVLNYPVGGLNPHAVDACVRVGGKFVWTPGIHSSHQYKVMGNEGGGIDVIDGNGQTVQPLKEIFDIIAENDLILVLGHSSVRERFIMIEEARKRGVKRILVDHPSWWLNKATPQQQRQMADMGAYVGLYWCAAVPNVTCLADPGEMLDVIENVPVDRIVGGSDAASVGHPDPLEAMRELILLLLYGGVPKETVEKIFIHNANRLIFGEPNEV